MSHISIAIVWEKDAETLAQSRSLIVLSVLEWKFTSLDGRSRWTECWALSGLEQIGGGGSNLGEKPELRRLQ